MKRISRLHPVLELQGDRSIIAIDRAAAIPTRSLGRPVGSARTRRDEIMTALDFLFTGF